MGNLEWQETQKENRKTNLRQTIHNVKEHKKDSQTAQPGGTK